jgi:hypothetical protein
MKDTISIKLYSILFFLCFSVSAFADAANPEEAPEDVAAAPISGHIYLLFLVGIVYVFYKTRVKTKDKTIDFT